MTMNAWKINTYREANPDTRLNEQRLLDILGLKELAYADLSRADLTGADLFCVSLVGTNLSDANMTGGKPILC